MAADPFHLLAELQSTVLTLSERVRQLEGRVRELEGKPVPAAAPPPAPAAKAPPAKGSAKRVAAEPETTPLEAHREKEKKRILAALEANGWNRVKVAAALGVPRRTLYRRLKEYGLQ